MPSILIMAGGTGERFWPASSAVHPKQYLPLTGRQPMILETVYRVIDLVGPENIYVITTKAQLSKAQETLSVLPAVNILAEPEGRNTAPCLILSVSHIKRKRGKNEVLAVLPADHFIRDNGKFRESLALAFANAAIREEIITFGIKPDRPETGYGYIAIGPEVANGIYRGLKFVEKPDSLTAGHYVKSGGYLWNSGMFIFQIKTFIKMLKKYSPQLHQGFLELEKAKNGESIAAIYSSLPKTSIDYGLMEKLPSFSVIPGAYGWDDLGTWRSLETTCPKDINGNIIYGKGELIDVSNSIIHSSGKLIAVIGVKDLVIAESPEGILVCSKDRVQEVKHIAEKLKTIKEE